MTDSKIINRFVLGASVLLGVAIVSAPFFAHAETLTRQLEVGSTGSDVSALQAFLAMDPTIYPQGLVTGYYGFLSKSAVSNFQSRNGLPPVGRVGPMTLPVLNLQMANGANSGYDISAPAIRTLNIERKSTSADIRWTTSDLARGKFFYSTTPITMTNTFEQTGINSVEPTVSANVATYDSVARMAQSVTINNLRADTTYYYMLEVLDASNNISITLPASFHTTK